MSEGKNINISSVSNSVDKLIENVASKPSKCIGQTFEDIWELLIGNRLHYARKNQEYVYQQNFELKMKKFQKEIQEEIEKIDESKRVAPDFQTIAILLQDLEYCIERDFIRRRFAKLIASTMNKDKNEHVHPIFGHILKHMNCNDAVIFEVIALGSSKNLTEINSRVQVEFSVRVLLQLGVISIGRNRAVMSPIYGKVQQINATHENDEYVNKIFKQDIESLEKMLVDNFVLSEIGKKLGEICL